MKNNCAILLAGGQGERFGKKKQFINFMGKPLWEHSYLSCKLILPQENIIRVGIDIPGGETRSLSVINGLNYLHKLNYNFNKVIIVEAARPLITPSQIQTLFENKSDSVTYVMPLVNTVIKRDGTYVNREDYYDLLTPQAFNFKLLYEAYNNNNNQSYTDETRVMFEKFNIKPTFIQGGQNLVKLTYLKDLPILEKLFYMQKEGKI